MVKIRQRMVDGSTPIAIRKTSGSRSWSLALLESGITLLLGPGYVLCPSFKGTMKGRMPRLPMPAWNPAQKMATCAPVERWRAASDTHKGSDEIISDCLCDTKRHQEIGKTLVWPGGVYKHRPGWWRMLRYCKELKYYITFCQSTSNWSWDTILPCVCSPIEML